MFHLRKLEEKDAPLMLEWMQDASVVQFLRTDFQKKTLDDCMAFIRNSTCENAIHMAICNESDEYLGTVSLRNIYDGGAEFAITIRKSAMGRGVAAFGMNEILKKGLEDYGLEHIYWCVTPENKRAVRFYEKNHYERFVPDTGEMIERGHYTEQEVNHYIWYRVSKDLPTSHKTTGEIL